MYKLNLEKISNNCNHSDNKKFGSTNFSKGDAPHLIYIDEGEYNYFVQILFMIKQRSLGNTELSSIPGKERYAPKGNVYNGKWIEFTKDDLMNIINDDIHIYNENRTIWGNTFIYKFENMADKFLEEFCIKIY